MTALSLNTGQPPPGLGTYTPGSFDPNLLSSEEHTISFGTTERGLGGAQGPLIPSSVLGRLRITQAASKERLCGRVGTAWRRVMYKSTRGAGASQEHNV